MKKIFVLALLLMGMIYVPYAIAQEDDLAARNKTVTEIGSLVNSQKYQIALTKCNAAIKKYPDESFLYFWRASIQNSTGNKQLALDDLNKSIELNPNYSRAYVLRGICKSDLEDKRGALDDLNKAIELDPNNGSAYSMRACVKLDLGDFDSANEDLDMSNKLMNSKELNE